MSISHVGSCQSTGPSSALQAKRGRPDLMARLENDDSDEAKTLKAAIEKLQTDLKSGTVDAITLEADRQAFHDAMKAYHDKNAPPDQAKGPGRPPGPPPIEALLSKLETDDSAEAQELRSVIEQIQASKDSGASDTETVDANKAAFEAALEAFLEKLKSENPFDRGHHQGMLLDTQA